MSFKYEIDDEFIDPRDDEHIIIRNRMESDRGVWYWAQEVTRTDHGVPFTIAEESLEAWKKVVPFFQVGDRWSDDAGRHYRVTDVDTDVKAAWVRITEPDGSTRRSTFRSGIWEYRKSQIIKNRSN